MNYESTFITSPELQPDKVEELTAKVTKLIESSKGTVKSVQQLGKKRLAYPIAKFREGSYVYIEWSGEGSAIAPLENFLKLNDSVIRYLTIKVEKKKVVAKKAAPKAAEAASEVKKDDTANQQSALA
ncbi:30S ribosomal protein S6 [Endomicrobium proavitum]|uniref:Small ribosomal subunit protein bS6 n=1 Tax=Endomicrobium proavitum TaxID=1408281 RepID=A0A0G3WFF3_9BACT|nr:30S ribosomal protein S6 [Endomicrobium proavitum]AKL97391.1 30S ribosomal protein S6 [Endomicrobium proavitum]